MSSARFLLATLTVLLATALLLYAWRHAPERKEVLAIGLGAPLSGPFREIGHSMRRGAELAVQHINQRGELKNFTLELVPADDKSGTNVNVQAEKAARELMTRSNIVGVVGHYFSVPTIDAGDIYRMHSIPFVTPSATLPTLTANNDWAFGIMPDDYYQALFLANYVIHGLNRKKIAVIHSRDPYGNSLSEFFVKELQVNNLKPTVFVGLDKENFQPERLKEHIDALNQSEIVFLAMNYVNAAKAIQFLRKNSMNADFIGAESLGGAHFLQEAGIYAEDVYAVTPYLPSLFGEESKHYQHDYIKEFQREPDWVSTYSYEAVKLLAHAIGQVGKDGTRMRNFMRKMISHQEALSGIAGDLHFNETGSSRRPLSVGQVKQGRFIPARFQLTPVKYQELAKAKSEEEGADIFTMEGRFMKRATVVYTGIHVDEIKAFNPVEGSFVADFNLWFRWDPGRNKNLDFEMTYGKVLTASVREKYFDDKTNNNFISYAVSSRMVDEFPLHEYPFDQQVLKIRIKPKLKTSEELILVTDIDDDTLLHRKLDFGSWKDIRHFHFTSSREFLWSYRNPKYDRKLFTLDHSQYNYHVILERKVAAYVITLLPLMILVASAYVIFTIDFEWISSRYTVGITTMLSAMAYHNVNKLGVGYLVRGDLFFLFSYVLFFFTILETSVVGYFRKIKRVEIAQRLDIISLILYPILVGVALVFLLR
ncbi:MAG: ABC transporter substrate-binding protein [Magnetococcales bacterium]|nr:ABC transporter substrate-binding protein [Magnetococcales bacterium]